MREGKNRAEWDHTAAICHILGNMFATKPRPFHHFHPYLTHSQPYVKGTRWTPQNNDMIIRAFTERN